MRPACRLFAAVLVIPTPATFVADAYALLASTEAPALLGQPVVQVAPSGPQRDGNSGGQLTYCTYRAAASAVVVSVVEFPSGAEARKQLTKNSVRERMDAADANVSEEIGPGETSLCGVSAKGAMYLFLKKNKAVGLGIGGSQPSKTSASNESL